jgi:hypothetical protein
LLNEFHRDIGAMNLAATIWSRRIRQQRIGPVPEIVAAFSSWRAKVRP